MFLDGNTEEALVALPEGRTPEEVARHFGVSPRKLRQMARELGACRIIGNRMFLLPADIEIILEASKPKPKPDYHPRGDYAELLRLRARMKKEKEAAAKKKK
ncbi:hypothetical protein QN219_25430 [Sinorhizobium sp. 7-81]|uniref:hypothetical protein n=1 Tax=Sinorhizobium sp. 8-89 TaxID=3049089 RepID=UPI0024C386C9|nr:hypothetical protein [Sinorhizobium sp. 8-89]MDK1493350.1 hypothetical protein [Sinorhizobium sp. 8-89]